MRAEGLVCVSVCVCVCVCVRMHGTWHVRLCVVCTCGVSFVRVGYWIGVSVNALACVCICRAVAGALSKVVLGLWLRRGQRRALLQAIQRKLVLPAPRHTPFNPGSFAVHMRHAVSTQTPASSRPRWSASRSATTPWRSSAAST
jgi:hypothetical protein